ncbi:MAG TPA: hypothetical protein VFQ05_10415 [Candidatus Eisenbacteria bacterium]|nr:hypothetical protein [Candidatus Eisenbacteria bacterium]
MRSARTGFITALIGAILVGLFFVGMQWLVAFFGKGTAWRN